MARVLVARQPWGTLWEKAADRKLSVPAAGTGASINTTVYSAATGSGTVSSFVTDTNGELPGWVDEGTYTLTVNSVATQVEALGSGVLGDIKVVKQAPLNIEHPEYDGGPSKTAAQNSTAIAAALAAIPAAGGEILFPRSLSYDTTITLVDGERLLGAGAPKRFRGANTGTTLTYTGTGSAVRIANPSGVFREGVEIHDLRLDGTGLAGTADGLKIDGTVGGADSGIQGLLFRNTVFSNFPRHQVLIDGLAFDISFDHCSFYHRGTAATIGDLIRYQQTKTSGGYVGQVSFHEPWFLCGSTSANWCFNGAGSNVGDVRFYGGTVALESTTYNGIRHTSGLFIFGTHFEGWPGEASTNVGIRYVGAQAALIFPGYCGDFGTGVQIGDPANPTERANGAVIGGVVGANDTVDIHVLAGATRRGTVVLATSEIAGGPASLTNSRLSTDGVNDVIRLDTTIPSFPELVVTRDVDARAGAAGRTFMGHAGPSNEAGMALGSAADVRAYRVGTATPTLQVDKPVTLPSYTTAGKPTPGSVRAGSMIYVSDAAAGAKFQGSDGSAWVNLG